MKLPIPIFSKSEDVFTDLNIIKPKGGVLADTQKAADTSDIFSAMKTFIAGCVESAQDLQTEKTIEDKTSIKSLIGLLPYRSAEHVAIQIILLHDSDSDGIEGIYRCPRCNNKIISELIKSDDGDIDTRDFISQLKINFMENYSNTIYIKLIEPVTIKSTSGDILENIESFEMRYPTLNDCIAASKRISVEDSVRLQFAIYVEALQKVNDKVIDIKFKNNFGMLIFENIRDVKHDLGSLNEAIKRYGVQPDVKKTCNKCGKVWEVKLNTSNFFVSGLLSN